MKSILDPRYVALIQRLREIRKEKKIRQADLAEKLGIDRTLVNKTETFVRRLDFIELCDWLEALGYSLEAFLRDIGRL